MKTIRAQVNRYRPAVALGKVFSRNTQSVLRIIFFFGSITFALLGLIGTHVLAEVPVAIWWGAALISGSLWLDQILTFSYHNSFYFRGLGSVIDQDTNISDVTYDVAEIVLTNPEDITRSFCTSVIGRNVLLRCRILPNTIDEFLAGPRRLITADMVHLPEKHIFTAIDLGSFLLTNDSDFLQLFTRQGINTNNYFNSLKFVVGAHHKAKRQERWWSKDNLSKVTGLGRDWSHGTAFTLERFSRDIRTSAVFSTVSADPSLAEEKVVAIESSLAKGKGSNVLIVGEPGVGKMDLVMAVQKRMQTGKALHAVAGQHIHVLDTNRIFATHQHKSELEVTLIHLFEEALLAGNTIIVIENLSTFIREAEQFGVFIPELLDEYLATSELHVIATDTPGNFHQFLEPLGGFVRRFSEILIETADKSATTRVLEGVALVTESKYQVVFTYESLEAITTSADRYIVEGVMPDKAISLLMEVASEAKVQEQILITEDFVYEVVGKKTSVPVGPIKETERDILMHLEDILHQQVIGQNNAIDAIAGTMRRARAGIQMSDKPIGSFLFLGPTGVGKTETAKALAKVFFGSESKLERIDMSEFSGGDALYKLTGDSNHSGILSDKLREHPYCVLLLDEFEKASQEVHDIFLQILDEGIFTDGRGNKVNARNTIIIATSNAGADLISRTVRQREELTHLTPEIINHIIEMGIFRPELINRFGSTIVFEPLSLHEQGDVANLLLASLYERIKDRGYRLQVAPDLLQLLVEKGYNPEFGARPMQRVMQDLLEEKIAQKIIGQEVERGDSIYLQISDFTEQELSK